MSIRPVPKGHSMTEEQKASRSTSRDSERIVKTTRSGKSGDSGARAAKSVTPTSERIIQATYVKRRTAMKVLADR